VATSKDKTFRPPFRTLFNLGATRERTDGQLLERFAMERSELAELAFAALVERHGAMVMRVCHAQLSNPHDAQDAYQATFLILVKKARRLWVQDSLGPWLHQVALRTAACARVDAARRRRLEKRAGELVAQTHGQEQSPDLDLKQRLHEEIDRLPERYRIPIVLCDLEGRTCEEVARQMGRPVGTVKSWRSRGRERLRRTLVRAGLAPSITLEAALEMDESRAVSTKPDAATVQAATQTRGIRKTSGEVPASVWILVKGAMKAMLLAKLRTAILSVGTLALLVVGAGTFTPSIADDSKDLDDPRLSETLRPEIQSTSPNPKGLTDKARWNLTLTEALRIGLENSELIRMNQCSVARQDTGGYEIELLKSNLNKCRVKSEFMAYIHAIEERYWDLSQQHLQLWSCERAVDLLQELKNREEIELDMGRGSAADVAKVARTLEEYTHKLTAKVSAILNSERQLRNVLGLPASDERRILPASGLSEVQVSPDWNLSFANMLKNQPDIAQALSDLNVSNAPGSSANPIPMLEELTRSLRINGKSLPPLDSIHVHVKKAFARTPELQELVSQATETLARSFLELDLDYKQFKIASRLRTAAAQRLEAQKWFYEVGRITLDRYLDAITQYTNAALQEAQYKTSYNVAIAALEEAQGTLLEQKRITIVDAGSRESRRTRTRRDGSSKHRMDEFSANSPLPRSLKPTSPPTGASPVNVKIAETSLGEKEVTVQVTIAIGSEPVTIRGSFSIHPASSVESP